MGHGDSDCLQSRLEKIVDERLSQLDSEKRHQAKRDKDLDKKLKEFCTAVGAYVAEKKGMEAQEVEELCNNIATAYHEYFWLFERYQLVKDRFSGKERFDMFLNDMLERSYGLNCKISNIGDKKGFIVEDKSEGTLWLSTASGDEVVLAREPHVDRFKLLRYILDNYASKLKSQHIPKFGNSPTFTYQKGDGSEVTTQLTAKFNVEPWDNIFHDIHTCLMAFEENNLGSLLDTADPNIHYMFFKTDELLENVPKSLCMAKLVDVTGSDGKRYVLVEGVYDIGWGDHHRKGTHISHLDNVKEGREKVYEYVERCLGEYAISRNAGLLYNVNFTTRRHGSQGPIEFLNYIFTKRGIPFIFNLIALAAKAYEQNTKDYPDIENSWPSFGITKHLSEFVDRTFTPIRYLNSMHVHTKHCVKQKVKGNNYTWGIPIGDAKVVKVEPDEVRELYKEYNDQKKRLKGRWWKYPLAALFMLGPLASTIIPIISRLNTDEVAETIEGKVTPERVTLDRLNSILKDETKRETSAGETKCEIKKDLLVCSSEICDETTPVEETYYDGVNRERITTIKERCIRTKKEEKTVPLKYISDVHAVLKSDNIFGESVSVPQLILKIKDEDYGFEFNSEPINLRTKAGARILPNMIVTYIADLTKRREEAEQKKESEKLETICTDSRISEKVTLLCLDQKQDCIIEVNPEEILELDDKNTRVIARTNDGRLVHFEFSSLDEYLAYKRVMKTIYEMKVEFPDNKKIPCLSMGEMLIDHEPDINIRQILGCTRSERVALRAFSMAMNYFDYFGDVNSAGGIIINEVLVREAVKSKDTKALFEAIDVFERENVKRALKIIETNTYDRLDHIDTDFLGEIIHFIYTMQKRGNPSVTEESLRIVESCSKRIANLASENAKQIYEDRLISRLPNEEQRGTLFMDNAGGGYDPERTVLVEVVFPEQTITTFVPSTYKKWRKLITSCTELPIVLEVSNLLNDEALLAYLQITNKMIGVSKVQKVIRDICRVFENRYKNIHIYNKTTNMDITEFIKADDFRELFSALNSLQTLEQRLWLFERMKYLYDNTEEKQNREDNYFGLTSDLDMTFKYFTDACVFDRFKRYCRVLGECESCSEWLCNSVFMEVLLKAHNQMMALFSSENMPDVYNIGICLIPGQEDQFEYLLLPSCMSKAKK